MRMRVFARGVLIANDGYAGVRNSSVTRAAILWPASRRGPRVIVRVEARVASAAIRC